MTEIILPRRGFLAGLGLMMVAPAIIKAENLMRVGSVDHILYPMRGIVDYCIGTDSLAVRIDCANFALSIPNHVPRILSQKEIKNILALSPTIYSHLKPSDADTRVQKNVTFQYESVKHLLDNRSDIFK